MLDAPYELPSDAKVDVRTLSRIFNNTSGTYKFYWFLSLLDLVCLRNMTRFTIRDIASVMVAKAWYPRVYFRLSFGFQEKLSTIIDELHRRDRDNQISKQSAAIANYLINSDNLTSQMCRDVTGIVQYRFLNPWLKTSDDSQIAKRSRSFTNQCLYAICKDSNGWFYEVNPCWIQYLRENYQFLKDFAYWHLLQFLQQRNPNVPNIVNKLVATDERPAMNKQRKFWAQVMADQQGVESLYTGQILREMRRCDLDHFMPWSFVTHNQLWNLIPVEKTINSSKSDQLPDLSLLPKMAEIQHRAIHTFINGGGKADALEDFCDLGIDTATLLSLSDSEFLNLYTNTYTPMRQLAINMGFETWHPNNSVII